MAQKDHKHGKDKLQAGAKDWSKVAKEEIDIDEDFAELQDEVEETTEHAALGYPSREEFETKLTEAEQRAEKNWNDFLRAKAENDNLQRRLEREVANAHKFASEKFLVEMLPVVDSLEKSLELKADAQADIAKHYEGIELTLQMLQKILEKFGVTAVDPEGHPFDPNQHEAMTMVENPDVESNTVVQVLQKGYLLNGRVVRPALVIVAK